MVSGLESKGQGEAPDGMQPQNARVRVCGGPAEVDGAGLDRREHRAAGLDLVGAVRETAAWLDLIVHDGHPAAISRQPDAAATCGGRVGRGRQLRTGTKAAICGGGGGGGSVRTELNSTNPAASCVPCTRSSCKRTVANTAAVDESHTAHMAHTHTPIRCSPNSFTPGVSTTSACDSPEQNR